MEASAQANIPPRLKERYESEIKPNAPLFESIPPLIMKSMPTCGLSGPRNLVENRMVRTGRSICFCSING